MKKIIKNNEQNYGQIAIIILLASAILLTLGLSASKITTSETKIETDEESLKTAFNTAESAINNYISGDRSKNYSVSGSGATIVSTSIGDANSISSNGQVLAGNNQLFWLVSHNSDGIIGSTYYNSDFKITADNSNIALKIDYFYIDNSSAYQVNRFGCYAGSDTNLVGFSGDCTNISVANKKPLLVSVTPLGGSAKITISGSSNFPVQGEDIISNSSTNDGVKTQIKTRYIYEFPAFMLDAVTAKGNVE